MAQIMFFWLDTCETIIPWSQYLFNTHPKTFWVTFLQVCEAIYFGLSGDFLSEVDNFFIYIFPNYIHLTSVYASFIFVVSSLGCFIYSFCDLDIKTIRRVSVLTSVLETFDFTREYFFNCLYYWCQRICSISGAWKMSCREIIQLFGIFWRFQLFPHHVFLTNRPNFETVDLLFSILVMIIYNTSLITYCLGSWDTTFWQDYFKLLLPIATQCRWSVLFVRYCLRKLCRCI